VAQRKSRFAQMTQTYAGCNILVLQRIRVATRCHDMTFGIVVQLPQHDGSRHARGHVLARAFGSMATGANFQKERTVYSVKRSMFLFMDRQYTACTNLPVLLAAELLRKLMSHGQFPHKSVSKPSFARRRQQHCKHVCTRILEFDFCWGTRLAGWLWAAD